MRCRLGVPQPVARAAGGGPVWVSLAVTELEPMPPASPLRWKIVAGLKVIARGETSRSRHRWPPDLAVGSYRLHLTDAASVTEEAPLIVAPPKAFGGDFDRCWLLAVQLYGVRSARNWGIGDFTDLEALIELASQSGGGRCRPQSAARAVR